MRVSRQTKDAFHQRIVTEASRLLRRRGVDATSVAEVMTAAGRTHGGFYRHFSTKQALVAAAVAQAFQDVSDNLEAFETFYLSQTHLRHPDRGCPIAALGGDIARQPTALKRTFGTGLRQIITRLTHPGRGERDATRHLAMLVGAMVMARASDPATATAILDACRSTDPA